jgi:hypothetical protein
LRQVEAEDRWVDATGCVGPFYPNFAIFLVCRGLDAHNTLIKNIYEKNKMIYTFALDINFLYSGEEKPTYLYHFLINILLFIILDKSKNQS